VSNWTQPVCDECWWKANPQRVPVRVIIGDTERCCRCGVETNGGIYIRVDPATVAFPQEMDEEEQP